MPVLKFWNTTTGQWESVSTGVQGPQGPGGPPGPPGPDAVEVKSQPPPANPAIELWVDPQDFQGDSGWQGFDARYVNTSGDTMTAPLFMKHGAAVGQSLGEIEPRADGGLTFIFRNSAGTRLVGLVVNNGVAAWVPFNTLEGLLCQNGFGGATTFEVTKAGAVRVPAAPVGGTDVANKTYVDNKIPTATVSSSPPSNPVVGQLWATP